MEPEPDFRQKPVSGALVEVQPIVKAPINFRFIQEPSVNKPIPQVWRHFVENMFPKGNNLVSERNVRRPNKCRYLFILLR